MPTDSPPIPSPRAMAHSPVRSLQNRTRSRGTVAPVPRCRDVRGEPETPVFRGGRPFLGPRGRPVNDAPAVRAAELAAVSEPTARTRRPPSGAPSGCPRTDRGALPAESARVAGRRCGRPRGECVFEHLAGRTPGADGLRRVEFRGPTLRAHPFTSRRFHVLLNSLFKVLFNFPSRYLSAIGLVTVFSLRWSLPPTLGCILKQPDSRDARSRRVPRR